MDGQAVDGQSGGGAQQAMQLGVGEIMNKRITHGLGLAPDARQQTWDRLGDAGPALGPAPATYVSKWDRLGDPGAGLAPGTREQPSCRHPPPLKPSMEMSTSPLKVCQATPGRLEAFLVLKSYGRSIRWHC